MRYLLAVVCIGLLCAVVTTVDSQEEATQAYVGAQLIPVTGPPIQNGVVVVSRGKIVTVGTRAATRVPAGAQS
jgi:imidazolonepropionase-like amidohydrolase